MKTTGGEGPGEDWRPTASLSMLHERARALQHVRAFFAEREILEVETPLLGAAPVTDPNIEALRCESPVNSGQRFLQTSPEYAMKRLLAAGSGPIWQLCKAFRKSERGRRHNPEFSLLEWYRPGWTLDALMGEVAALVNAVLPGPEREWRCHPWRELFHQHLEIDPATATTARLEALARERLDVQLDSRDPELWLDLLFSHLIEPQLGREALDFVVDYPAPQCALAKLGEDADGLVVARRFELFVDGLELANGYDELCDPREQRRRFESDNQRRLATGLEAKPLDERLLAALEAGMPACAGVALGFDRLLILARGASDIEAVIAFPCERA